MRDGDYNSNCPLSRSKPFRTNLPIELQVQAALIRTRSIERASRRERAVSVIADVRVGSFGFDLTTSSARAEPDYNTGQPLVPPARVKQDRVRSRTDRDTSNIPYGFAARGEHRLS